MSFLPTWCPRPMRAMARMPGIRAQVTRAAAGASGFFTLIQSAHRPRPIGPGPGAPRESGTVRLEEAVDASRAALTEWTRERQPLEWATTQNNLGTALETLGERESGTARLD